MRKEPAEKFMDAGKTSCDEKQEDRRKKMSAGSFPKKVSCCERQETSSSCIDTESLSAFLDGEYTFTAEEKAHLEKCPFCQKELALFKKFDDSLQKALRVDCPDELVGLMVEKVRIKTKEESRKEGKKFLRFSPGRTILHAAASLLLFSLIAYLLMDNPNLAYDTFREETISEKDALYTNSSPEEKSMVSSLPAANIDIRNLVAVSSGNPSFRFLSSRQVSDETKPVVIPDKVKQLWLYDKAKYKDPSSALEKLLAEKANKNSIKKLISKENNSIDFSITATRKSAVILVRHLAAKGLRLVTPVQPQPEQHLFYGNGNEKTLLLFSFLPEKSPHQL